MALGNSKTSRKLCKEMLQQTSMLRLHKLSSNHRTGPLGVHFCSSSVVLFGLCAFVPCILCIYSFTMVLFLLEFFLHNIAPFFVSSLVLRVRQVAYCQALSPPMGFSFVWPSLSDFLCLAEPSMWGSLLSTFCLLCLANSSS
jgi:hypothetical protein